MTPARRSAHRLLAAALASAALTSASQAAHVTDATFFDPLPTTLITFETDGSGTPVTLIQGQRLAMPSTAYATQGVLFSGTNIAWVNDGNAAFDAAQTIGASPVNSIPSSLCNEFTMTFTVPVQAFGFFVANNRTADPAGPIFVARDINGNILDTAAWGGKFIDGTINSPNTIADYGFMGISSPVNIASVTVTKQAAILDDLRFSPVPAPGAIALGAAGSLAILRRRRR